MTDRKPATTRKAVEKRHRAEWDGQSALLADAIKDDDSEKVKFVKLVAETLKLCQEGERKAWQLDRPTERKVRETKDGASHGATLARIERIIVDPRDRDP